MPQKVLMLRRADSNTACIQGKCEWQAESDSLLLAGTPGCQPRQLAVCAAAASSSGRCGSRVQITTKMREGAAQKVGWSAHGAEDEGPGGGGLLPRDGVAQRGDALAGAGRAREPGVREELLDLHVVRRHGQARVRILCRQAAKTRLRVH